MKKNIICKDVEGKEYEIDPVKLKFRPSVYGILIDDNKILLVRQFKDGFDFPGGGIELDETVEEALKREFWEETGLKVEPLKLVDIQTKFFRFRLVEEYVNSILIYYLCKKIGGKLSIENFDEYEKKYADMPEWIDINQLEKVKFYNSIDSIGLIKGALDLHNKK